MYSVYTCALQYMVNFVAHSMANLASYMHCTLHVLSHSIFDSHVVTAFHACIYMYACTCACMYMYTCA